MPYNIVIGRDDADKERFGERGLIFLGKSYVKMGNQTSLSNKIWMDIARSHIILVAGKRGCLTEDTLIFTNKGYKPIKDFNSKKDKILSFNKNSYKLEWEKAELIEYTIKDENLLQIELEDGRIIKLTKEHPLLSSYGKYEYYRKACDLKIKDKIILPTKLPEIKKDKESLRVARLLGFILADGTINIRKGRFKDGRGYWYNGTKARIRINNACEEVLVQAKKDFEDEFKIITRRTKRKDCNCEIIETKHQRIINKFIELGIPKGLKSGIIRIPKIVFESSNKFKANFISALFDCDGYINQTGRYLDYASKSRKFLEDLQILLTHFNIESSIRIKNAKLNKKIYPNYRLFVTDNQSVENFKRIGFHSKFKQERLNKHKYNNTKRRKRYYPSKSLVCVRIKSIKEIDGINKVYDLSVDKNHSFIANGVISHNSGKSYTLGVIAEELSTLPQESAKNIASLIFDTMGIFWTMKYKNEKDKQLLEKWGLQARETPIKIFIPRGKAEEYEKKQIPFDDTFALSPSELEAEDWITLFNLKLTSLTGVLIQRTITNLKENLGYTIKEIQKEIQKDQKANKETKEIVSSLFDAADSWGIFSKEEEGTEISELISAGKTTVLDVSIYSSIGAFNIRALIISLISRKLFKTRMDARKQEEIESIQRGRQYLSSQEDKESPLVWIFIDECLTGNTEIITNTNHTPLQEVIRKVENGEKIKVMAYNPKEESFEHYPIKEVYKKGKRKTIKITTETGKRIKCTPEHRVLTRHGFASAFSVKEIATPIIQYYSEDKERVKARILGHLLGDGWANEKTQSLGFSGKRYPKDLNKIKKDLDILKLKSSGIYSRKTTSQITNYNNKKIKIDGTSHSIQASRKAFRYFDKLGIVKGDKITQPTRIPEWIKRSNPKIKAEFLAALMGSDGQVISKSKKARGDFNAIRFSFNKIEKLENTAWDYANEIKNLFESIGIKISNISKRLGNSRKDGTKTIKIVLTLKKDLKNTIKFLGKVGYKYCSYKEIEGIKWLNYLKARVFIKEEREKIYKKALKLKKSGLGKTKISKKLNFPEAQIRDWIYNGVKPGLPKTFPDIDEWINERLEKKILYERLFRMEEGREEEVYDISVDKVHNFVSNGLITHNCHEFLPKIGITPATDALMQLLREGRQPGISLVLATQQPGQIHKDVMTQSDIVLSHRVTAKPDIEALNEIMQTYLLSNIKKQIDDLPSQKGSAIILDDNSERLYPMRVRPRFTWHGGEAPTAIQTNIKVIQESL